MHDVHNAHRNNAHVASDAQYTCMELEAVTEVCSLSFVFALFFMKSKCVYQPCMYRIVGVSLRKVWGEELEPDTHTHTTRYSTMHFMPNYTLHDSPDLERCSTTLSD